MILKSVVPRNKDKGRVKSSNKHELKVIKSLEWAMDWGYNARYGWQPIPHAIILVLCTISDPQELFHRLLNKLLTGQSTNTFSLSDEARRPVGHQWDVE
jgi:hypothetical protein